jgi:ATP-dependent protease Clp ATPase subunit
VRSSVRPGARALRGVIEEIMLDHMFDLPELKHSAPYTVSEDVVSGDQDLLAPGREPQKESA